MLNENEATMSSNEKNLRILEAINFVKERKEFFLAPYLSNEEFSDWFNQLKTPMKESVQSINGSLNYALGAQFRKEYGEALIGTDEDTACVINGSYSKLEDLLNKNDNLVDALMSLKNNPGIEQWYKDTNTNITATELHSAQPESNQEKKSLKEVVTSIESTVGKFSTYQTTTGHGQDIPFTSKPAQQMLRGVGVPDDIHASLSEKKDGKPIAVQGNDPVIINSFDSKSKGQLEITGARIDRLVKSAKTYVNTDIFPKGHFSEVTAPGTLSGQTQDKSAKTGVHLQNMAVGVCHVQEIDLLAAPILNADGLAIMGPRTGKVDVDDPAILLLSTPALNVGYGTGQNLTTEQQSQYIESMYRTLFHATVSEGREYIALPAAGLGVFGGDPETYFSSLMKVAQEFPKLNIVYNSGHPNNAPVFDKLLDQYKPGNIVRTDRDVLFVAHELTQQGISCAFHNPSDADVVLGINDVGEYWKKGKGSGYVGEEHIGAMSTAPLNSRLLNPNAYEHIIEHSFLAKPLHSYQEAKSQTTTPISVTKGQTSDAPSDKSVGKEPISEEKSTSLLEYLINAINSFIATIQEALGFASEKKIDSDHDNRQGPK